MRLRLVLLAGLVFSLSLPRVAVANSSAGLELSELLPDPAAPLTDNHDEFTEVHNVSGGSLDLTGYQIKVSTHSYTFGTVSLDPDAYTMVTSGGSALTLSNSGATVQLLAPGGVVIDTVTYGAAKTGQSWAKIDGVWAWTNQSTPGAANVAGTAPSPSASPGAGGVPGTGSATASSSPLLITELLPNPAAPLTDAHDEFIELMNPSDAPVDLTGYVLKASKSLSSHYTLGGMIAPAGYAVFTSGTDHLQLANAGSSVALFDPSGNQVDVTVSYGAATTGYAYARFDSGWAWTTTPTPGADNVMTAAPVKMTPTKASTKVTSVKSTKAKSTTAKSTTKKLSSKAGSAAKTAAAKTTAVALAASRRSGTWLLLLLGGLTIGFVIYEFRYDVIDLYHRARSYATRRFKAGS